MPHSTQKKKQVCGLCHMICENGQPVRPSQDRGSYNHVTFITCHQCWEKTYGKSEEAGR